MAGIQVKASRRNGRMVKAHTRRRRAIRNAAIGAAGIGAIAGGGLLLKKKLGVKPGTALGKSIRIDGRAAAMGRTGKAGARQQREAVLRMQQKMSPAKRLQVQRELEAFDRGRSTMRNEADLVQRWTKLSPEAKQLGLAGVAASGGPKAARQLRQSLLKGYRQTSEDLIGREKGFNKVNAYRKHFRKGGDRAGQELKNEQYNKLINAARGSVGKSAAGIRANIRRDLGFSGNPDLTTFTGRRWRKV